MFSAIPRTRDDANGAQFEPVSVDEVKANSNITITEDDQLIMGLIIAATDYTENLLGRLLVPKTVDLVQDGFPADDCEPIILPYPPLISVTSIKYYDDADTLQTWDSAEYEVNTDQHYYGLVYPNRNESYPATRQFRNSVQVEYIAGYQDTGGNNDADRVPQEIKQAILMLVGHLYENREATTVGPNFTISEAPFAYHALTARYRTRAF